MKIGKKIFIIHSLTTIIAMLILGSIISYVISDYIESNIRTSLEKRNMLNSKILNYYTERDIKYIDEDSVLKKKITIPIGTIILKIQNNSIVKDRNYNLKFRNIFSKKALDKIINQKNESTYSIRDKDKSFIAYNNSYVINKDGQKNDYLVVTFASGEDISAIKNKIRYILILSILFVTVILIIVSKLIENYISKPINILVKGTKKIAERKFDSKVSLKTNDEFNFLAESINMMAEELKFQDIRQKNFYEHISHEMKTPITVISGYIQCMKNGLIENEEEIMDIIILECNKLKKQMENIIYLNKLDTFENGYSYEKIDVNNSISNALLKVDSLIIINEIDVIFEPKNNIFMMADKKKLERMLINIFSNCIKYTKDSILIETYVKKKKLNIDISDNGEGFSNEILKNPFNCTVSGNKEGTGIGLRIIKKIVEGHQGEISLSNLKEGGARYKILFNDIKLP
jgi:signal transduction histidine kinase